MDVKSFIKAARLRTLPLSVSGIIVGSSLGNDTSILNSAIFWLAIVTTIGFQVLSNFANDYGDGIKGSDKNRTGEARMVASGAITPKQMKNAMIVTTIITLLVAILLIFIAFGKENFGYAVLFFFLGIASIIAAIKYTVGKSAYGYSGFGDVFVFLFFGLLSVVGSYFLYTKQLNFLIFLPATAVTFSEKVSPTFAERPTPVALSLGDDEDNVGAVESANETKFKAVLDEIPT